MSIIREIRNELRQIRLDLYEIEQWQGDEHLCAATMALAEAGCKLAQYERKQLTDLAINLTPFAQAFLEEAGLERVFIGDGETTIEVRL